MRGVSYESLQLQVSQVQEAGGGDCCQGFGRGLAFELLCLRGEFGVVHVFCLMVMTLMMVS